jgi:hypothetical protein
MHRGYVKLWRKIVDWSWYKDANTLALFIHLLIKSNHKDTTYMGQPVPRGSCVCGRFALAEDLGISEMSIRTALTHLKSTNDITIKTTNRFSIICIANYSEYQDESTSRTTSKLSNSQPTANQQLSTSKECKNEKNEKNKAFVVPTESEVSEYFTELNYRSEFQKFFDHFTANGWRVGRGGIPMKCWKATARNWCRNAKEFSGNTYTKSFQKDSDGRSRLSGVEC